MLRITPPFIIFLDPHCTNEPTSTQNPSSELWCNGAISRTNNFLVKLLNCLMPHLSAQKTSFFFMTKQFSICWWRETGSSWYKSHKKLEHRITQCLKKHNNPSPYNKFFKTQCLHIWTSFLIFIRYAQILAEVQWHKSATVGCIHPARMTTLYYILTHDHNADDNLISANQSHKSKILTSLFPRPDVLQVLTNSLWGHVFQLSIIEQDGNKQTVRSISSVLV